MNGTHANMERRIAMKATGSLGIGALTIGAEHRLGRIEDIVRLARLLTSPESQWVNGQTSWINGGLLAREYFVAWTFAILLATERRT